MKALPAIVTLCMFSIIASAHPDSTSFILVGGANGSYEKGLRKAFPDLVYSYNPGTKTHNYSGNWDFDGDGIKDSLFFIGSGGEFLLFSLCIKLSSEQYRERDFPWIVSDLPYLGTYDNLEKYGSGNEHAPWFVVHDFDGSGIDELYLDNRMSTSPIPKEWQKLGVTSHFIIIKCEHKDIVIRNFKKKWLR